MTLRLTFFRSVAGNDQVPVALPDFTGVTLQNGIFQVSLNLSASDFHTVFNGTDYTYIQIEDLTHNSIYPRQKFSAVPYALKVPVDGESITYNVDGKLSLGNGNQTLKLPNTAGAANKVLKSDGNGALVWSDDLSGGAAGSITSSEIQDGTITDADVNATAGISHLKISGLGGLATKSAVGSSEITDGTVSGTDIASGTITDTNISASAAISSSKISGLGGLATKSAVGSSDITDGSVSSTDIADGTITDADINATAGISYLKISGLGSLASKSAVGSSDITDGSIADGDISASAAIAGSKVSPNFGAQNVVTTGGVTGATVQANTSLKLKSDNANSTILQSPAGLAGDVTLTLPACVVDGATYKAAATATAIAGNIKKVSRLPVSPVTILLRRILLLAPMPASLILIPPRSTLRSDQAPTLSGLIPPAIPILARVSRISRRGLS